MLLPLRGGAVKYYIDVTTSFLMPKAPNDNKVMRQTSCDRASRFSAFSFRRADHCVDSDVNPQTLPYSVSCTTRSPVGTVDMFPWPG